MIERTEVTVAACRSCVDESGCAAPKWAFADVEVANYDAPGRDLHPVNFVSQGSAAQSCEARGARLCHPEEWERQGNRKVRRSSSRGTLSKARGSTTTIPDVPSPSARTTTSR